MGGRIPPSARIEADIEALLLSGTDQPERLSELRRQDDQLVLQRTVEEEVAAFLDRARYERTPDAIGSRNGSRSRLLSAEAGDVELHIP